MTMGNGAPLFRKEVADHRSRRLHGDVSLAPPVSWQIVGGLLLATLIAGAVFITGASYSRVQTVSGVVELDTGVATITPSRSGVVSSLSVRDGEHVRHGQPLVQIRAEEDMTNGATVPRQMLDALSRQDRTLASQSSMMLRASDAERSRIQAQIAGVSAELSNLEIQISDQRRLVSLSERELRDVARIAERGFISRRDVESREAAMIERRQHLAQLQQARASKKTVLTEAQRSIVQTRAAALAQMAGVQSSRAELSQRIAEAEAQRGYTITSPLEGRVTALTGRVGQRATTEDALMVIAPSEGRPRVELHVPPSAIGFVAPGQEVRLAVDAFPFERFGTVRSRISRVSATAIRRATAGRDPTSFYLVTAELPQPTLEAYGRPQALLPGMTLSARIVTDRRSLLEWLFDPIFAVRRR